MTNTDAVRQLIKEKGLKYGFVASELGITTYGLQLKINNKNEFKSGEIARMCATLGITSLEEKERIFFARM
jgi:hypothetical protein